MTDLEWEELRIFRAASSARSFSKAAKALRVGQATVSRRVAALEARVGKPLFDRVRDGLVPTPAAELLRPFADAMADAAGDAAAALEGFEREPAGDVRLALTPGVAVDVLPPHLGALRKKHPRIALHVFASASEDGREVARREIDVAVVAKAPASGDLLVRRLADVAYGVFASPAYVRALPRARALETLDFIGWAGPNEHLAPAAWLRAATRRPPVMTVDNTVAMCAFARAGAGAVVFPELLARSAGLARVPVVAKGLPTTSFYLVTHRSLRRVPRVAAIVDFVLDVLEAVTPRPRPRSR